MKTLCFATNNAHKLDEDRRRRGADVPARDSVATMYQRCRMGCGSLPQEASVFRKLTVEENLLAILETLDLSGAERRARARELLAELDLTPLAPYPAYTPAGRILVSGTPSEIANNPVAREISLGDRFAL